MTYVRAHDRKKPSKPPEYISKHEQLRAEVAAAKRVNDFRDEIHYEPGSRPIDIVVAIAGKLKRLALTGRA
jgi:hypothetical protein